ncbi:MAG: carboxypeptidase-like regulatory domain-containing protein, partial [Acidobacteriaceae bacterium]|nr:carboxypeptidase-like regulatory domain-containing protein [Acidobacteriaceae bacterium]
MLLASVTAPAAAQSPAARQSVPPLSRLGTFAPGALAGAVVDEQGLPVEGVVVSALGATTMVAVTDKDGHFEFGTLTPGPYVVRAHLTGYAAPRAQTIQILTSTRSTANLSLRHEGAAPAVVAAGFGGAAEAAPVAAAEPPPSAGAEQDGGVSETAWRVRHARASVLKDLNIPGDLLVESGHGLGAPIDLVEWAVLGSTKTATAYLTETSFTGQFNL